MNILFIGVYYFNYEKKIKKQFEDEGNKVTLVYDRPKKYITIHHNYEKIDKKHMKKVYKRIKNKTFDMIFVLVGRRVQPDFLELLKKRNPRAKFVLYLWDDVARVENFNIVKDYYNLIFSFDDIDCKEYNLIHLPLFYTKDYFPEKNILKKYDLFSSLSLHSDRYTIIEKIVEKYPEKTFLFYFSRTLYAWLFEKLKKQRYIDAVEMTPRKLTAKMNRKMMCSSDYILDIQAPSQNGLTMRTIETLACQRKLITTNRNIEKYDFYSKKNIQIIDRDNPQIEWCSEDFEAIDEEIYKKYSISAWVKSILYNKTENYLKNDKE